MFVDEKCPRRDASLTHFLDGFSLAQNKWDSVRIDDLLENVLSLEAKSQLEIAGYLG